MVARVVLVNYKKFPWPLHTRRYMYAEAFQRNRQTYLKVLLHVFLLPIRTAHCETEGQPINQQREKYMSLLKTLTKTYNTANPESIKEDFKSSVIVATGKDNITHTDVADLVSLYAQYSICYLQAVAMTLDEPVGMQSTMKFMNSLIAEFVHAAQLHYYHMEGNYSIVDKAIQVALDGDGYISQDAVLEIVGDIELSHAEEEFEEVE